MQQKRPYISEALRRSPLATGKVLIDFKHARLEIALSKACNAFAADPSQENFETLREAKIALWTAEAQRT